MEVFMYGMKVRYEIKNMYLKVGNVTRDSNDSYVLLRAFDNNNNEIVIELSHEQAEFLEDQFFEANSRWEDQVSMTPPETDLPINVIEINSEDVYSGDQYSPPS
jgi:hypothetical protein